MPKHSSKELRWGSVVTSRARIRRASCLTLVLLACLESWSGARAEDVHGSTRAPLPVNLKDYETLVQKLAAEVDGNEAAMATRLRSLGFSCTPVSKPVAFQCVRFGCQKRIVGPGSLLQWTVNRRDVVAGKTVFSGGAINYSWLARCIVGNDIEAAQQRSLSCQGQSQCNPLRR